MAAEVRQAAAQQLPARFQRLALFAFLWVVVVDSWTNPTPLQRLPAQSGEAAVLPHSYGALAPPSTRAVPKAVTNTFYSLLLFYLK